MNVLSNLHELEISNQWKASVLLIEQTYLKDEKNEYLLIRILFQCWFVINVISVSDKGKEFDDVFFEQLFKYYFHIYFTLEHRDCYSELFLGFILSIVPIPLEPYEKWEKYGNELIERSFSQNPTSPIARKIMNGKNNSTMYSYSEEDLLDEINYYFPGKTVMEQYFREVLLQ